MRHALTREYAPIREMRLITCEYGIQVNGLQTSVGIVEAKLLRMWVFSLALVPKVMHTDTAQNQVNKHYWREK